MIFHLLVFLEVDLHPGHIYTIALVDWETGLIALRVWPGPDMRQGIRRIRMSRYMRQLLL